MNPEQLLYAKTHEWLQVAEVAGKKIGTVGISQFAVEALTDLVYLDLPEVGKEFKAEEMFGQVESVKAVSDLYSPVGLRITEVNASLPEHLERLSDDPFGAGWVVKGEILDDADLKKLLNHADYEKQCAEEGH